MNAQICSVYELYRQGQNPCHWTILHLLLFNPNVKKEKNNVLWFKAHVEGKYLNVVQRRGENVAYYCGFLKIHTKCYIFQGDCFKFNVYCVNPRATSKK